MIERSETQVTYHICPIALLLWYRYYYMFEPRSPVSVMHH